MDHLRHRDDAPPPWYRQFWPWFLIALPASVVAASMFTIWLATRSPNPMVVDDYSRINRSTELRRERDLAAAALDVEANIRFVPGADLVELELWPATVEPEGLQLRLSHPLVAERDHVVELVRTPAGWSGSLPPLEGRWYVQLYPSDGSWRLSGEVAGEAELRLAPPATP
ncbi:FixH family protein [Thioalkalivibrio sp. XN8]|uniref:FixH family protein n=1 Tax=Thioalkalivibrio sp. XN8 TaxID=2712863 RepID=UPI0013EC6809|nr:FixH family protein [Thioalkalivibrio sp. XN8]NGP54229.1 FixH family protein [Thioalkalivibrio sp. XN8]